MHRDRFVLALVAMATLVVGLVALNLPMSLDQFDSWGLRIYCGSGVAADYEHAALASQTVTPLAGNDYVAQCSSALGWRRGWAGSLVLVGMGLSITLLMRRLRGVPAESRSA